MTHRIVTGQIAKSDTAGLIYVPIYAPWRVDTQVEAILPEYLAQTALKFADDGRLSNIKISWRTKEHKDAVRADAEIVDWLISEKGDDRFPVPGTWAAAIQLKDPALISAVEKGEINAVSLESEYPPQRAPLPTLVKNPIAAKGDTDAPLSPSVSPHSHSVDLTFDEHARIVPTWTGITDNHRHLVAKPTAVEPNGDHGHPLDLQKLATDYQDTLQVVTWLSDLSVADITLVAHAASWMPIVALKGDTDMAGGIVQAIIVPEGADIGILKELLGEEYEKIKTDNTEQDNGSTVYVQANKADFDELNEPVPFRDTPIKFVTGKPKAEKADAITLQIVPPPEEPEIVEWTPDAYDRLWKKEDSMMQLIRGAFGQNVTAEYRRQIVMVAIENFRASVDELITAVGDGAVEEQAYKTDKSETSGSYGVGDLASRLVAEVKKTNKQMLEEFKGIARKAEKVITKSETNLDGDDQANKGDGDMTKDELKSAFAEFAAEMGIVKPEPAVEPKQAADTTPEVPDQLKVLSESVQALTAKLDEMKTESDALKSDNATLKTELEKIQSLGQPVASVDPVANKADPSAPENSAWGRAFTDPKFIRSCRSVH